jgi:hypothetical protein
VRLARPFYRLPIRFDAARLAEEVQALPADAWARHPTDLPGNSALRLISVNGGENDEVDGAMRATSHLERSPYIRQVLTSFGVIWSRSRLMRLAAGATVAEHADVNYHWHYRVRLHIPVLTRPEVIFCCGDAQVHMAAGEAWIFDNWRLHSVVNPAPCERIHLVADTTGSAAFWRFVAQGDQPDTRMHEHAYRADWNAQPLVEQTRWSPIMNPAEVDLLVLDLRAELAARQETPDSTARLAQYHALLDGMRRDWRQLYALHGEHEQGWPIYAQLRDNVRKASQLLGEDLITRTNGVPMHKVLEARLLRALAPRTASAAAEVMAPATAPTPTHPATAPAAVPAFLRRPLFIVAAPRSGSTLLFETLAVGGHFCTVGGEAHWLVEDIPELRPGAPGVESNRLSATQATPAVTARMISELTAQLRDSHGLAPGPGSALRLLEKTPKNALRVPFFDRLFPDALFLFLWRDPRENISSIIEAWRSGRWKTYNGLPGFDGPWSLLLPPGWQSMNGRPLEEIAAFQWDTANRIAIDDLERLSRDRWLALSYGDFLADPRAAVECIADFAGFEPDTALRQRLANPLPHSQFTLTPPERGKWLRNEGLIERVLPGAESTWRRLEALTPGLELAGR